jgi:hypothetical protein
MKALGDAALALIIVATPVVLITLWMLLLNARDRRDAALRAVIGQCCSELGLRGIVGVDVTVGACRRTSRVTLDMRLCTAADVCRVIDLLEPRLPRGVIPWIVVTGPSLSACAEPLSGTAPRGLIEA